VSNLPAEQEPIFRFHSKKRLANSTSPLGVEKSGKERIYSFPKPSSTPPTKKSLRCLTDWDLASREEANRNDAESSDSFVANQYRKTRIAGKGAN